MQDRIPDQVDLPELTLRGLVLGALITVVFTASNVYLGLKVGLTFASSIPAAVISMAVLRYFSGSNILENNMVQTQASAAGTLSSIIFILPGLLMVGHWSGFSFWQTASICAIGGTLGVLYTIPLRRVMVVHSSLPYPEGVAAAEILRVGSHEAAAHGKRSESAQGLRDIVAGGVVAALFSLLSSGFKLLAEAIDGWVTAGQVAFRLTTGFSLALLGAGYLMGITAGIAILVGTLMAWGVAVPWLMLEHAPAAGQTLPQLAQGLWRADVRFLGAGTIGIAALWTLATLFKPMVNGIRLSLGAVRDAGAGLGARTDQDIGPRWIVGLALALATCLLAVFAAFLREAAPSMQGLPFWGMVAACVVFAFVFGFLVAAACGYMAGLVGSSSSPISGIGIIAVILVSLLILGVGALEQGFLELAAGRVAIALALFTTSVVLAIAAISNDNLQDLKTGYLVGATPWRQQVALIVGCVVGALVIPPVLELLFRAYGFTGAMPRPDMDPAHALAAPQATLMTAIATGIFRHTLNWHMIGLGVVVGIVLIAADVLLRRHSTRASLPPLAVGLGIYLPPGVNMALVVGALLSWVVARALSRQADAGRRAHAERRGVLLASGLIVGESLMGIVLAGIIGTTGLDAPLALVGAAFEPTAQWLGLAFFVALCVLFYRRVTARAPG